MISYSELHKRDFYVPPIPKILPELRERICAALQTIDRLMQKSYGSSWIIDWTYTGQQDGIFIIKGIH